MATCASSRLDMARAVRARTKAQTLDGIAAGRTSVWHSVTHTNVAGDGDPIGRVMVLIVALLLRARRRGIGSSSGEVNTTWELVDGHGKGWRSS